jgi:hypothetical protein
MKKLDLKECCKNKDTSCLDAPVMVVSAQADFFATIQRYDHLSNFQNKSKKKYKMCEIVCTFVSMSSFFMNLIYPPWYCAGRGFKTGIKWKTLME